MKPVSLYNDIASTSYPGRGKQGTSGTGSHRAQGKYGCAGNAAV